MQYLKLISIFLLLVTLGCKTRNVINEQYESENLKIERLTENTFVHISYLETEKFGKVACNGMIVMDNEEAIVIDTPANEVASIELINFLENILGYKVIAVIPTHFHVDCLGGLNTFHKKKIASYALNRTLALAKANGATIPQNGFETSLELKVGHNKVISDFLGEGHTKDNIICYFPSEKVMFGGCLIKSEGASKGNLNDANVYDWSDTVRQAKTKYSDVDIVIPGHGKTGGANLFDYTINLFK